MAVCTDDTDDADGRLRRLFASTERIAQIGSWEYLPSEDEVFWSDNVYRIFGVDRREWELSLENIFAETHPDDRQRVVGATARLVECGGPWSVDFRITRRDGDRRHLRATLAAVERDGRARDRFIGLVEDLTERRRAEREIAAHVAVQEALADWDGFQSGARGLLTRLAGALDCAVGVFWVPRGPVLLSRAVWHESCAEAPLETALPSTLMPRASGLASRVWEARTPLSWTATEAQIADPRDAVSRGKGLRGAFAIPALMGDDVLAIVELATDREIEVSERLERSLHGIAHELGHFLARRGGELAEPLLTPREIEVLQLAAGGLSARETAKRLTISPGTVKTHLQNIYPKLEVSDRGAAVATALRLGLID